MQAASYRASSERRRVSAFVLTIVAHVLIVGLLMRLGPAIIPAVPVSPPLSTFSVLPDPVAKAARAAKTRVTQARPVPGGAPPRPRPAVTPDRPVAAPVPPLPGLLPGGDKFFEAADIGKMPSQRSGEGDGDGEGSASGSGRDSVAAYGPGAGPGGQRMYNAELVRAPTGAELAFYLTKTPPTNSWGEIACRMTESLSLENCRVLSESPAGSGLGRALRQAAWQFKIRPPRIEKKAIPGTWVRIHLDWNRTRPE